jgi:hypothetical protein
MKIRQVDRLADFFYPLDSAAPLGSAFEKPPDWVANCATAKVTLQCSSSETKENA